MMSVDERNARALLERIEILDREHNERLEKLEAFAKGLMVELGQVKHRLNVLIATTASTGPTERNNGDQH